MAVATVEPVDVELAPLPEDDEREGAQVALVDPTHSIVSERLTASVRRTGPASFAVVQPRTFTFTRLRAGVVAGLGVYVGDWQGQIRLELRLLRSGDEYTLHLPGG